jgi:hypothetical protein
MKILVYGTDTFEDYSTFMRGLVVAIDENVKESDGRIEVFTAGPRKINSYTAEFINKTEGFFRQKKIRTRFRIIPRSEAISNFETYGFDHVLSFNNKKDPKFFDVLIDKANILNINSSYYKY